MALTAGEIIAIRREVGAEPDDTALNLAYDRLGSIGLVALEILETRYADLVSSPAQFTVFGEYGQNTSQNLIDMRMQLERLRSGVTDTSGVLAGGVTIYVPTYDVR
jgi:hypothetical protein